MATATKSRSEFQAQKKKKNIKKSCIWRVAARSTRAVTGETLSAGAAGPNLSESWNPRVQRT